MARVYLLSYPARSAYRNLVSRKRGLVICSVNSRLADTPLLRTGAKSSAETRKKCMEITPAFAGSRYYGIVGSHGPKVTFLLFYSRYNGHLGSIINDLIFIIE